MITTQILHFTDGQINFPTNIQQYIIDNELKTNKYKKSILTFNLPQKSFLTYYNLFKLVQIYQQLPQLDYTIITQKLNSLTLDELIQACFFSDVFETNLLTKLIINTISAKINNDKEDNVAQILLQLDQQLQQYKQALEESYKSIY